MRKIMTIIAAVCLTLGLAACHTLTQEGRYLTVTATRYCSEVRSGVEYKVTNPSHIEAYDFKVTGVSGWHLVRPGRTVTVNGPNLTASQAVVRVIVASPSGQPDEVMEFTLSCPTESEPLIG